MSFLGLHLNDSKSKCEATLKQLVQGNRIKMIDQIRFTFTFKIEKYDLKCRAVLHLAGVLRGIYINMQASDNLLDSIYRGEYIQENPRNPAKETLWYVDEGYLTEEYVKKNGRLYWEKKKEVEQEVIDILVKKYGHVDYKNVFDTKYYWLKKGNYFTLAKNELLNGYELMQQYAFPRNYKLKEEIFTFFFTTAKYKASMYHGM